MRRGALVWPLGSRLGARAPEAATNSIQEWRSLGRDTRDEWPETLDNPFGTRLSPMSQVRSVTHVSGPDKARTGAAEGIRTPDPRITNAVLYRLSYRGVIRRSDIGCAPPWQERRGGVLAARVSRASAAKRSETRDPGRYDALFPRGSVRVARGPGPRSRATSRMNGRAGALAWPGHATPRTTQCFSGSCATT